MDNTDYDTDTFEDDPEDSPVIKKLRAELRQKEKALQDSENKLAQVETAEQTRRAEAAERIMDTFNLPGLKDDVLQWVEGPITEKAVAEALKVRSINVPEDFDPDAEQPVDDEESSAPSASQVGQQLAAAAGGADKRDLDDKMAEANSAEELESIMAEAGLIRNHS